MERGFKISNKVFVDHRGTFAPLSLTALDKIWIQSNISFNPKKGTFRGLHFQVGEFAQAKLVKVITGCIIDFIVDIRPESDDYMKVYEFLVNPGEELYVPRGYAHGFLTIEENTVVQYLVDNVYSPENEGSIYWKEVPEVLDTMIEYHDGVLNEKEIIISEKDLITKNFNK
jgi:dTDP-4-dehydrorhamnose 3,5-epimerase